MGRVAVGSLASRSLCSLILVTHIFVCSLIFLICVGILSASCGILNSIRILGSDSQEVRVYRVCTEAARVGVTRLEVIALIDHISKSFHMSKSLVSKRSLRSGQPSGQPLGRSRENGGGRQAAGRRQAPPSAPAPPRARGWGGGAEELGEPQASAPGSWGVGVGLTVVDCAPACATACETPRTAVCVPCVACAACVSCESAVACEPTVASQSFDKMGVLTCSWYAFVEHVRGNFL